jgi:hypothetical protein
MCDLMSFRTVSNCFNINVNTQHHRNKLALSFLNTIYFKKIPREKQISSLISAKVKCVYTCFETETLIVEFKFLNIECYLSVLAYFLHFEKKGGIWDHISGFLSVCVCPIVYAFS